MKNKKPIISIIGDYFVGKTAIIESYLGYGFKINSITTIGIDIYPLKVKIKKKIYELSIKDTAGQEQYHSLSLNSVRNCQGIILVYSRNDFNSFHNIITNWINSINDLINLKKTPCILVENKNDLELDEQIKEEEINNIINEYNLTFIRSSAKENKNIKEIFEKITQLILEKKQKEEEKRKNTKYKMVDKENDIIEVVEEYNNIGSFSISSSKHVNENEKNCC